MKIWLRHCTYSCLLLLTWSLAASAGTLSVVSNAQWVQVKYVFDGDTFMTEQGERIRLLGINTPEVMHGNQPGQVMGGAAKQALQSQLTGQVVRLEFDRQHQDRYGRTLAQVWRRDGRWLNGWLVEQGYAHVYTFAPNIRWTSALLSLEQEAIAKHRGIWKTHSFAVLDANKVRRKHVGQFRLVEGQIDNKLDKRGWAFRLGTLRISVPRKYRQAFASPPAIAHQGETIRVRGRIRASRNGQLYLAVHHPLDMESN